MRVNLHPGLDIPNFDNIIDTTSSDKLIIFGYGDEFYRVFPLYKIRDVTFMGILDGQASLLSIKVQDFDRVGGCNNIRFCIERFHSIHETFTIRRWKALYH